MDRKKKWDTNITSDKIDFKTEAIKRDPKGYLIIFKGSIHQKT